MGIGDSQLKVKRRIKQEPERRSHATDMVMKVWARRHSLYKHLSMGSVVRYSLYSATPRLQTLHKLCDDTLIQDYDKEGFVDDLLRYVAFIGHPKDQTYALLGVTSHPTSTGWTQTFSKWLEQHCEKVITDTRTPAYLQAFGSYLRRFASEELTAYSQYQDHGLLMKLFEVIDDPRANPFETMDRKESFKPFMTLTQWHRISLVLGPFLKLAIESSQLRKLELSRLPESESSRLLPEQEGDADLTRTAMYHVPSGLGSFKAGFCLYITVGASYADVLQTLSENLECLQEVFSPSFIGDDINEIGPMVVHR
ncbi:uncharacterized protein B0I36DRAFT_436573 [Microdochium trichocladiopsis]|uniref:Uncharacterized protein n=1 Tax=Microdochium trichocladiopsis TaxID=1682393 RepID=A0A9P9BHW9_9PEZI|nr:uncharacterized protein B0I36DRAFT_436573 [Microdochium trichocladiopsis]KAH7012472.1 hypothetical protein B0I36DRAFT_436573 [Microdochium trichocladiopsis]